MFRRVLIANRGEIAVRIIRSLRQLGIASVAVYSDADRDSLAVQLADEAYRIGPPPARESYLNIGEIVRIGRQARVDAVHPGYGFLAENAAFAEAVAEEGMIFVGPSPASIRLMGDKVAARRAVRALGVPVVPGTEGPVRSLEEAQEFARQAGYPIAMKAAGGGGGRGIRIVREPAQLAEALERASREAETFFRNAEVYLERFFDDPKHIEAQVLGDRSGDIVALGERDCSVQRRHQKLIEESPSPALDSAQRAHLEDLAVKAAQSAGYFSAGTVECLLSPEGELYFLEMNTRIQVEHPVTEEVTGIDLVAAMVQLAEGAGVSELTAGSVRRGHAIEVRINAEDPAAGFRPSPAKVTAYRPPGGPGIRVDSGVQRGWVIPEHYDSLVAKLIAWAPDRETARRRAVNALAEFQLEGPTTTMAFSRAILEHPTFVAGDVGTAFLDRHLDDLTATLAAPGEHPQAAGHTSQSPQTYDVEVNGKRFAVRVFDRNSGIAPVRSKPKERRRRQSGDPGSDGNDLLSPLHGTVIAVKKTVGEAVRAGDSLFVIEAMKMENEVAAHRDGTLAAVAVQEGETVEADQTLATIE